MIRGVKDFVLCLCPIRLCISIEVGQMWVDRKKSVCSFTFLVHSQWLGWKSSYRTKYYNIKKLMKTSNRNFTADR